MNYRFIEEKDNCLLIESLLYDKYHKGTSLEFFLEEGTVCSVYEDSLGPILFLRGKPILYNGIGVIQLDIQFVNNDDGKRNLKAMLWGLPKLEDKAKENGFTGMFFTSNVPILKQFCVKRLGFTDYGNDLLAKILLDKTPKDMIE